ncbi:MAG: response regulator, partial [Bacteroidales bacterium]|nr:response regulator [Bacteroidales bacterium]
EGDSRIQFYVGDEAAGSSMENLEASFHGYFKTSKSVEASFDLAGLRLMVAKAFADMIDGKIWSSSKPGLGSTFHLSLVIKQQERKEISEKVQESKSPDWSGVKILIAEDVEPNYLLLKELLKLTRAEMIWAKDGKEAVAYFQKHGTEIDIVLMDIVMPEMDGFEAAQKIREMSANIPIIGQTAYSLEFEKNTEQLKSFNGYLTKPIWYHELISIVGKYL